MSNPLFTDTVTLYNWYRNAGERVDRWRRTVLRGVQWKKCVLRTVTDNGLRFDETVSLTIPEEADTGGKTYLPPAAFQASARRAAHWTLDAGHNQDVLVYGECPAELGDDYGLAQLKAEYGFVTVKGVRDNTLRQFLKHWKVDAV